MTTIQAFPALLPYIISALVLTLNLLFLWGYSGVVRTKVKGAVNEEDSALYDVPLNAHDPEPVARVLRAHRNAEAIIYPYLVLGLVYSLIGGDYMTMVIIATIFTLTRLVHSVYYLGHAMPHRTIAFTLSGLVLLVLMGEIAWILV